MPRKPEVTLDITSTTPALRRGLIDAVLREVLGSGANDTVTLVYDHEPVGLGYELELRKDTRGRFDFTAMQRNDGCWIVRLAQRPFID